MRNNSSQSAVQVTLPSGIEGALYKFRLADPGSLRYVEALRVGESVEVKVQEVDRNGLVLFILGPTAASEADHAAAAEAAEAQRRQRKHTTKRLAGSLVIIGLILGLIVAVWLVAIPLLISWLHQWSGTQIAVGVFVILMILGVIGKIVEFFDL